MPHSSVCPSSLAEARSHGRRCLATFDESLLVVEVLGTGVPVSPGSEQPSLGWGTRDLPSILLPPQPHTCPHSPASSSRPHSRTSLMAPAQSESRSWQKSPATEAVPYIRSPLPSYPSLPSSCRIDPCASRFLFSMTLGLHYFFWLIGVPTRFLINRKHVSGMGDLASTF